MAHEPPKHYVYAELKYADSIRVLELLPGARRTPLTCKIHEVLRSDNPPYEAVSYTWGVSLFSKRIFELDSNAEIHITENLFDALEIFRYEKASRILWVDAICIDQASNKEKNHQVAQMGNIFEQATNVLVWLGRKDASKAIAQLEYVGQNYKDGRCLNNYGLNDLKSLEENIDLDCLKEFFDRDWFYRVWIVQEFTLAKDIIFVAGDQTMSCGFFEESTHELFKLIDFTVAEHMATAIYQEKLLLRYTGLGNSVQIAYRIIRVRNRYHHSSGGNIEKESSRYSLLRLSQMFEEARCTLEHDRIYAFLGLAKDNLSIMPDYDRPVQDVWRELAIRSLLAGGLYTLHFYSLPTSTSKSLLGSSSAAAFHYPSTSRMLLHPIHGAIFNAGRHFAPYTKMIGENFLELSGIAVDTATKSASHSQLKTSGRSVLLRLVTEPSSLREQLLRNIYDECYKMSSEHPFPYIEDFETILAHTLVADNRTAVSRRFLPSRVFTDKYLIPLCLLLNIWHCSSDGRILVPHKRISDHFGPLKFTMPTEIGGEARGFQYKFPAEERLVVGSPFEEERVELEGPLQSYALDSYPSAVALMLFDRTFFVTSKGYIGIGPEETQTGDLVVIFDGANTPFILRPIADCEPRDSTKYYVVGNCYLHGWMDGDMFGHEVVDKYEKNSPDCDQSSSHAERERRSEEGSEGEGRERKTLERTSFVIAV